MNKQEFIERMKFLKNIFGNKNEYIEIDAVIELASELDEPQPMKLKNIISRMGVLNDDTRKEWIDAILYKFGERFGTLKYRDGYEQGKVEGLIEREKVTIPQFVVDVIEGAREKSPELEDALHYTWGNGSKEFTEWYKKKFNRDLFARAWLDGYTVEKEKRYLVKIIGITNYNSYLNYYKGENKWTIESRMEIDEIRTAHTRKQLEEAGFGWVFDCEGIEIEEVEE